MTRLDEGDSLLSIGGAVDIVAMNNNVQEEKKPLLSPPGRDSLCDQFCEFKFVAGESQRKLTSMGIQGEI